MMSHWYDDILDASIWCRMSMGCLSGDVDGEDGGRASTGNGLRRGGDHPGDAAAQGRAGLLLPVGVEHVAVVDPPGQAEDLDLAQPALALAAVGHHVEA